MNYENENDFDFDEDYSEYEKAIDEAIYWQLQEIEQQNNCDFEENPIQKMKLIKVFMFLVSIAEPEFDKVYPVKIEPKYQSGQVSALFTSITVMDYEKIKSFSEIISYLCNISIIPTLDNKLLIELVVPGVYTPKK